MKHGCDERALVWCGSFFFDDRRQGDNLVARKRLLLGSRFELFPYAIELLDKYLRDRFGAEPSWDAIRLGVQISFETRLFDAQRLGEFGVRDHQRKFFGCHEPGGLKLFADFGCARAFGNYELVRLDAPRGQSVQNRRGRPTRCNFVFADLQPSIVAAITREQAHHTGVTNEARLFEFARNLV